MKEIRQKIITKKGVGSLCFICFVIASSDEQGVAWKRVESLAREARRGYRETVFRVCQSEGREKRLPTPLLKSFYIIYR
jgi:hypothetical protein